MKKLFKLSRQLHKWLALIVVTQMLIWVVTGVLFGFVDGQKSSGAIFRDRSAERTLFEKPIEIPAMDMKAAYLVHQQSFPDKPIHSIKIVRYEQQWLYLIASKESQQLFDRFYNRFQIGEQQAKKIALLGYTGAGNLIASELLNQQWRLRFDDELATDIYVSASTGRVIKHYNNISAFNNFLKLLHFMDYTNEHNFNHWWIQLFAIFSFIMTLSGCYWLYQLIKLRVKRWIKR